MCKNHSSERSCASFRIYFVSQNMKTQSHIRQSKILNVAFKQAFVVIPQHVKKGNDSPRHFSRTRSLRVFYCSQTSSSLLLVPIIIKITLVITDLLPEFSPFLKKKKKKKSAGQNPGNELEMFVLTTDNQFGFQKKHGGFC